jgi:hypothetical protein
VAYPRRGTSPPAAVLGYARQLAEQLAAASGSTLVAAYLHGSAALGGWIASRSDVDLLFVAAGMPEEAVLDRMAATLVAGADSCPGRDLESSVVTAAAAATPAEPWPCLLHVHAGHGVHNIATRCEDPDLLMHYAVCRAAAVTVHGPPAHDLIGPVRRELVLGYLAGELRWGIRHGSEAYAVLNACRATIFLTDGEIVSKIAGGETALARGTHSSDVITRALEQQRGNLALRPPAADAVSFVVAVATALDQAVATGPAGQSGLVP